MTAPVKPFTELRTALNERHIERREEINIALWALLARFHVCYIGPPGTAKSMLSRDLAKAITGAKYFERLLTKFSVPEEFFGPFDIPALQQGHYRRIIANYLPEADIAFLDEIWKANSAVINALLTIMNERIFHNNGSPMEVPLQTLFAASNEMPEGEELWAMFDRFQFRKVVNYIQEPGNFVDMLKGDLSDVPELSFDDLAAAQAAVLDIEVNEGVYETLTSVKGDLMNEGIIGSDRRYKQAIRAMQASAFLEGRDYVDDADFKVLTHMLWTNPTDVRKVERLILDHTNPLDREVIEIQDQREELMGEFRAAVLDSKKKGSNAGQEFVALGVETWRKIKALAAQTEKLRKRAEKQGAPTDRVIEERRRLAQSAKEVGRDAIGMDYTIDITEDDDKDA